MAKSRSKTGNNKVARSQGAQGGWAGWVMVDPKRIRYQHARIRPTFSGCGRLVTQTLQDIRDGKLKPEDLPPIQVICGPAIEGTEERWYFALNNRRLWVLKECRKEGLLPNDQIQVRVRQPKSVTEAERYTVEKCALEAKFMRDPTALSKGDIKKEGTSIAPKQTHNDEFDHSKEDDQVMNRANSDTPDQQPDDDDEDEEDSDDSSDEDVGGSSNPFSALM